MGVGIGLTFDEAALLLDLRDVYWTREGLLSVQLSLGATAILSIAILTGRMLRRGERRQEAEGLIPPADHRDRVAESRPRCFLPAIASRDSGAARVAMAGSRLWFRLAAGLPRGRVPPPRRLN